MLGSTVFTGYCFARIKIQFISVLMALLLVSCSGSGGGSASPAANGSSASLSDGTSPEVNPPSAMDPTDTDEPDVSATPPTTSTASPDTSNADSDPDVGCDTGERPIRLALQSSLDAVPVGLASRRIDASVNAALDGTACLELYPEGSLYNSTGSIEALGNGELEIAVVSAEQLSESLPEYALFDLPYLFEDIDALERFQSGEGAMALLRTTTRGGIAPIGFMNAGLAHTSANRPVVAPDDFATLKVVGSDSALFRAQYTAVSAFPVRLALSERYSGLLTGVVDAQESTWSVANAERFAEVQPFFTETNHRVAGYVLLVASDWWSALDPEERGTLERLFANALAEANLEARIAESDARQAILDSGVVLRTLGTDQRAAWVEAMQPVWQSVEDTIGVDLIGSALAANTNTAAGTPGSVTPGPLQDADPAPTVPAADAHPAEVIVIRSTDTLLRALRDGAPRIDTDATFRAAEVERIIGPTFEFEIMTQLAMGTYWREADATQQAMIVEEFKTLLLRSYADALSPYRGGTFRVEPFVPEARDDRAVIRSTISRAGESDSTLLHNFREKVAWLIFDVEINDVSLVTSYRAAFANTIERDGIDGLIDELARRNADAS